MSDHIERTIRHLIGAIRKMGVCNGSLDGRSRKSMDEVMEYLDKASCPDDAANEVADAMADVAVKAVTHDDASDIPLTRYWQLHARASEQELAKVKEEATQLRKRCSALDRSLQEARYDRADAISKRWQLEERLDRSDKDFNRVAARLKQVEQERDALQRALDDVSLDRALAEAAPTPHESVSQPQTWQIRRPGNRDGVIENRFDTIEADDHDIDNEGILTLRLCGDVVARYPRGEWCSMSLEKEPDAPLQCGMRVKLEPGVKVRLDSGEWARVVDPARVDIFLPDQNDIGRKAP